MTRRATKLLREGNYIAEVTIELTEEEGGWSSCVSYEDAMKPGTVRDALRRDDLRAAAQCGRVFAMVPNSV